MQGPRRPFKTTLTGVSWWPSMLRIRCHYCGSGLNPGLETSARGGYGQKQKKPEEFLSWLSGNESGLGTMPRASGEMNERQISHNINFNLRRR